MHIFTLMFVQPPSFIRSLLPEAIWRIKTSDKKVYLTFDDGPTPVVTEKVLKLLDSFQAKATFFCIGKNVKQYPEIYRLIQQKGHKTGNHTQHHIKGWSSSLQSYLEDVKQCSQYVQGNLFRPPYGQISRKQYKKLKQDYKIVMWDVLSWDFKTNNSPEDCARNVCSKVRPGSIIVFHDSVKAATNCLGALEIVLKQLHSENYEFCAL